MRGISEDELINIADQLCANERLIIYDRIVAECHELQEPWIPIETARKDGRRYLLFNIFCEAPCTGLFDGRQWVLHSDSLPLKNQPTHYQELPIHKPEPPR